MLDDKDVAQEALRRSKTIKARRARAYNRIKASVMVAISLSVVLYIIFAPGLTGVTDQGAGQAAVSLTYNGFAGGYILVGVICFALGVAVTLLSRRWLKKNK